MSEFETEPVRGLPELLPEGERMLWQGAPDWRELAVRALHARKVAIYFAALLAWHVWSAMSGGAAAARVVTGGLWLLALGICAVGVLVLLAWLIGRTTVYTITSQRVVIRFGIALPMTLNVPYSVIESAALRSLTADRGDIALALGPGAKVGYLLTWPHVRPWRRGKAQPSLRAVPDSRRVAAMLSQALAGTLAGTAVEPLAQPVAQSAAAIEPRATVGPRSRATAAA